MAVTLTAAQLAESLRLDATSTSELAQATRLLAYCHRGGLASSR